MSRGRAALQAPAASTGLKDAAQRNRALKMADGAQRLMNKMAKQGESDRHIPTKMPKHLFSGKRPGHSTTSHR
jgi:nucleolar GTP-binding protein